MKLYAEEKLQCFQIGTLFNSVLFCIEDLNCVHLLLPRMCSVKFVILKIYSFGSESEKKSDSNKFNFDSDPQ